MFKRSPITKYKVEIVNLGLFFLEKSCCAMRMAFSIAFLGLLMLSGWR
jgi:hypothetical protein